jgi:hypothetical protein
MGKVLHADASGYFVYCIQESADSRNAIWTLENAMKTYWRVRSWSFSASGTVESDSGPSPFSTSLDNIQSGSFWDDIYATEDQLVCGGGFYLNEPNNSEQWVEMEFGTVKRVGNLYNAGFGGYVYDNLMGVEYSFGSIPFFTQASSTITLFGGTLPIGARNLVDVPGAVLSLTATLTPTLWWSYGGTYDTATGNPL